MTTNDSYHILLCGNDFYPLFRVAVPTFLLAETIRFIDYDDSVAIWGHEEIPRDDPKSAKCSLLRWNQRWFFLPSLHITSLLDLSRFGELISVLSCLAADRPDGFVKQRDVRCIIRKPLFSRLLVGWLTLRCAIMRCVTLRAGGPLPLN